METKAKKFSKKLLALFLAVVMGITCFSGVLSAYAASQDVEYTDNQVEYNSLGWAVLTDEQVATALLDYADQMLAGLGKVETQLAAAVTKAEIPVISIDWNTSTRKVVVKAVGITLAEVTVKLTSVDELIETLESVDGVLKGGLVKTAQNLKIDLGHIPELDFKAVNGMRRATTSSCDIVRGVLGLLYDNIDIINRLLLGELSLGVLNDTVKVYDLIGGIVDAPSNYQSDMIYNIAQSAIFKFTKWYTPDEVAAYRDGTKTWVYDTELLDKLTTELLDKISVPVTYNQEYKDPDTGEVTKADTSATRYVEIKNYMKANSVDYATAAHALGYDPNIVYSDQYVDENGNYKNVVLFAYGHPDANGLATANTDQIKLTLDDSLFTFGKQALKMAWNTVLKDSVKLVHVNYGREYNDDGTKTAGSNYDNQFYYWLDEQGRWDEKNPASNYSAANVEAWAKDVRDAYGFSSDAEFLAEVQKNLTFDRSTLLESEHGAWSKIDSTKLFLKLRYSPLADKYFNMETGPINLYFLQLGTPNLDAFFNTEYANYSSLVAGLNDCLLAAVKDIFVESDNIIGTVPALTSIGKEFTSVGSAEVTQITNTLVANALKMVQYTADAMDANVLAEFYTTYGKGTVLTEKNLEEAMIPLLISCVGNIRLNGAGDLGDLIHPEDWDMCKSAEAVAFVCLREYLSYVLPQFDYNTLVSTEGGYYTATLNGTILPMARDAVFYVLGSLVPVVDGNGNAWRVENQTSIEYVDGVNDIFTLFNSVACYYADEHTSSINSAWTANGVASLLGVCDANGDSLISANNTLWDNIDKIANRWLPVLGVLQGRGSAQFSSYSLIWETIVEGVLDIGTNNGVTGFVNQLLTIFAATPIQSERIVDVVYDLLKDLINGLFGPRYKNQSYVPVPNREDFKNSTYPFDSFFKVGCVVGANKDAYGALPKLLNNFIEFAGVGRSGDATKVDVYPDSILPGLTFALTAVNSFLNLVPTLGLHQMNMASSSFSELTRENASASTAYTDTITFKNNCTGINKVYLNGLDNDSITQLSRYYIDIVDISTKASEGSISVSNDISGFEKIAPGEEYTINVSMNTPSTTKASYVVTTTYNVCDVNGEVLQSGLTTSSYKYITGDKSWLDALYPAVHGTTKEELARQENGIYWLASEPNAGGTSGTGDFVIKSTPKFQSGNNLFCTYAGSMVITSSNPSQINSLGMRIKNTSGSLFGDSYSMDGIYIYDSKTVANDAGGNVTVGQNNAIPVFDKATGSLLKYGMSDYLPAGAEDVETNWVRNGVTGYTDADIKALVDNGTLKEGYKLRTHVAYTLQEAKDAGIIAAYHYNDQTKLYEYVYMQSGPTDVTKYDHTLSQVTLRGPVDGIYIQVNKITQGKDSSSYFAPFAYDGSTQLTAFDGNINVCFYNSGKSATGTIRFAVADDSSKPKVVESFDKLSTIIDNYTPADFKDYDGTSSALYTTVQDQLVDALRAYAQPITPSSATSLSDELYLAASTTETTSELGDIAYEPAKNTDNIPDKVRSTLTVDSEGYLYLDKEMSIPVYSNTPLATVLDEANGIAYDSAWQAVKKGTDGKWHLLNAPAFETKWITDDVHKYYIQTDTETQKTSGKDLVYNQVTYVYRNASGDKCNSTDEWVVKFPATEYKVLPFDASNEYRGLYTQISDNLAYYESEVYKNLNTATCNNLFKNITLFRTNLNSVNYDVVTFQRMVEAAQDAEKKFDVKLTYTPKDKTEAVTDTLDPTKAVELMEKLDGQGITYKWTTESTLSGKQASEYQRLFDLYLGKVVQRGYMGNQIEAEILCASGNAYDNLTVTQAVPAVYDETGNETSAYVPATIKVNSGTACDFGTVVDGFITNVDAEGNQAYTTDSWNKYTEKLAAAVEIAQLANSTYAYDAESEVGTDISGLETVDSNSLYTCADSRCYSADSELQVAENTLVKYVADAPSTDGITISGKITIANSIDGADSGFGLVGIEVKAGDTVLATSAADGTFTAVVPAGTTQLTISGPTTIDRPVAVTATADVADVVIPVVMADYNKDGGITGTDIGVYLESHGNANNYNVYCDYNADGGVTATDIGQYLTFHGQKIAYADLTIA